LKQSHKCDLPTIRASSGSAAPALVAKHFRDSAEPRLPSIAKPIVGSEMRAAPNPLVRSSGTSRVIKAAGRSLSWYRCRADRREVVSIHVAAR
jgi:hypothetical protein